MTIKILALSGSQRAASFNALLVRAAADGAAAHGASITMLDWRDSGGDDPALVDATARQDDDAT